MYELIKRLQDFAAGTKLDEDALLAFDASDAIQELMNDLEQSRHYEEFWQHEAEEALRKYQVAIAKNPQWIPVTERLPSPVFAREWYLVALKSGCVQTLAFEKGGYSFESDKNGFSDNLFRPGWHETASPVTHWMPLPEPPKEETC